MSEETAERPDIEFLVTFGPNMTFNGMDTQLRADAPLYARIAFTEERIGTDDLDSLVTATKAEVTGVLYDLADYIKSEEYRDIFYHQLIEIVATYRGTLLRKGIPNRDTRRANGERPMFRPLTTSDETRVDL